MENIFLLDQQRVYPFLQQIDNSKAHLLIAMCRHVIDTIHVIYTYIFY